MNREERRAEAKKQKKLQKQAKARQQKIDKETFGGRVICVGSQFPKDMTGRVGSLPMIDRGVKLIVSVPSPSMDTIEQFQTGPTKIYLKEVLGTVGIYTEVKSFKDKEDLQNEFLIDIRKEPKEQQDFLVKELEEGWGYLFEFYLVDSNTNILRAMRMFTATGEMYVRMKELYEQHLKTPSQLTQESIVKLPDLPGQIESSEMTYELDSEVA